MRKIGLLVCFSGFTLTVWAQIVNIPDVNFKNYLLNNLEINTNNDNEIQVSEAAAYSGFMDVSYLNISDLTGIETFTGLPYLDCRFNLFTSLNVTANTALTNLICSDNQLASLDINSNLSLIGLSCERNQLTNLNVSLNTALRAISCGENLLSTLNVSNNTALTYLACDYNQLTNLDVSVNTILESLVCSGNQLTDLNLTANYWFATLYCHTNQLTILNVQNGNNTNLDFHAANNPNLTCIQVDNAAWSTANWTFANNNIDAMASFSENCTIGIDDQTSNSSITLYPNPTTSTLTIQNASGLYHLSDITGKTLLSGLASGETAFALDISAISSGIYFLTLSEVGQQVVSKVIKQ